MVQSNNKIHKVKIIISGFTKNQIEEGIASLLDEFSHRPWLLEPQAYLDDANSKLVIIVGYENDFKLEDGAFDEISDCIIATMNFDKEINFDIQKI